MSSNESVPAVGVEGQPERPRVAPTTGPLSEQARFLRKGRHVRAIYAACYARHMRRVRQRQISWPTYTSRWDGGQFRGRQHESIWPEIARFIYGLKLPYFEFVRHKFDLCSRTPPPPDALLSDIGVEELRQVIAEYRRQFAISLRTQSRLHQDMCTLLEIRHAEGKPVASLCWSEGDGRSALFLYCLAVYGGVECHIQGYRRKAIVQYLQCPFAYEQEWAVLLPRNMYEMALTEFGVDFPELWASGPPPDADQPGEE